MPRKKRTSIAARPSASEPIPLPDSFGQAFALGVLAAQGELDGDYCLRTLELVRLSQGSADLVHKLATRLWALAERNSRIREVLTLSDDAPWAAWSDE